MKTFRGNTSWLALVGAGFFWGWLDCLVAQNTLFEPFSSLEFVREANLLTYGASILPALIGFLLPLRVDHLTTRSATGPIIGLIGALGCAIIMLGGALASPVVLFVGFVTSGMALGGLLVLWGRVCVCQGSTRAFMHITGAYALSLGVVLLVLFLRPLPAAVFLALCPLASGVLFWVLAARSEHGKELALGSAHTYLELGDDVAPTADVRFEGKLVAIILSFYCVLGFANFVSNPSSMSTLGSQVYGMAWEVAGVVLFLCVVLRGWRARKVSVFGVVMLVMAAVTAFLPFSTNAVHVSSSSFMSAGCVAFDIICWSLVALLHHFTSRPYVQTVSIVALCQQAGTLLGYAAGVAFPQAGTDLALFAPIMAVLCAGLAVGIVYTRRSNMKLLATLFSDESIEDLPAVLSQPSALSAPPAPTELYAPTERSGRPASPDAAVVTAPSAPSAPGESTTSGEIATADASAGSAPIPSSRADVIDRLADEYRLTRREREVFAHLSEGRSAPYIAELHQVSENTVRSHIKHIYTKLDVHSRQELLTFVQDAE